MAKTTVKLFDVATLRSSSDEDHDKWRVVASRVRPDWDDDKFEQVWADFIEYRRQRCVS